MEEDFRGRVRKILRLCKGLRVLRLIGRERSSADGSPTLHVTQVRELQEQLKPILLRRKKEDVEKSIPQKEEVSRSQTYIFHSEIAGMIPQSLRSVCVPLSRLCRSSGGGL